MSVGDFLKKRRPFLKKKIAGSGELQEAVDLARIEMDGMEYLLEKDLREQMAQWKKPPAEETVQPPKTNRTPKWVWGLIAVGLVAGLLYFVNQRDDDRPIENKGEQETEQVTPERPIATDEETIPNETQIPEEKEEEVAKNQDDPPKQPVDPPVPEPNYDEFYAYVETGLYAEPSLFDDDGLKSAKEDGEDLVSKGKKAFVAKEYARSVELLESIDKESDLYEAAKEPLAHAYFKTRQFGKAAVLFKEIADESTFLKDEPEWYWMLSLMANYSENQKEADQLLDEILQNEDPTYREKVVYLKSKLEQLKTQ